jgi:hypothetical protein
MRDNKGTFVSRDPYGRESQPLSLRCRIAYSVTPLLVIVLFGWAISEISLRSRFDAIEEITGAAPWQAVGFGGFTYQWDEYHRLLGWTNVAGYRSDATIPFDVKINSQRLRASHDFTRRPASGITRIALFGDSLAFGEEVDNGETIADHLGRRRDNLEVLNYGVHGYGLGQSVLRLEIEGDRLNPDLYVLTVLFPEDLVRDQTDFFLHPKPVFRLDGGSVVIDNVPVPEASRTPFLLRHSFSAAWLLDRRGAWHRSSVRNGLDLGLGRALIQRAADVCRARGRPLTIVVMLAPAGVVRYVSEPSWRRRFDDQRGRFMAVGSGVVDLVPIQIESYLNEGQALFAPLAHWSSRGNRFWAGVIADKLDQGGLFVN